MPIDDLPPPPSKSDISDLPPPTPSEGSTRTERNLGRAGAFATGLGAGIVGAPGTAIEDVKKVGTEKDKSNLRKSFEMYATLPQKFLLKDINLPTISGIEKKVAPELTKEHPSYTMAGELAPAAAAVGTGAVKLGSQLPKLLGLDYFSLKKGEKGATDVLRSALEKTAGKESYKAGQKASSAESTARTAETAAEKAQRQKELSKAELPGFKTQEEAGRFKPIGQTVANIGDRLKASADKVYSTLKARRDANAQRLKGEAFADALNKEKAGQRITDTKAYQEAKDMISDKLIDRETKLANTTVGEIKEQLFKVRRLLNPREVDPATGLVQGRAASFESLDEARRFLRDRANGLPAEGYDAISQQLAGKLATQVEKIMTEFSPGFEKFIKQYAADSQPMRVFQTKAGKSMIDEQLFGKGANYASTSSESVANNVFKNKENFSALIDALGGNKQLAQAEAKRFFGSQLESKTSAKDIENFIRQNREMLRETGGLKDAEKYAITIRKLESRVGAAEEIAKANRMTANQKTDLAEQLSTFESQLAQSTPDQLPVVAKNFADNLVGKRLINQENYKNMIADINELKNMRGNVEDAKKRLKNSLYVTLVGIGGYKAYHAATGSLGL